MNQTKNSLHLCLAALSVAACGSFDHDDGTNLDDTGPTTSTQALQMLAESGFAEGRNGLRHDLEEGRTERLATPPGLAIPLPASRGMETSQATTQLHVTFPDGTQGTCEGAMVSPNAVLTQGHCVHDPNAGGFANAVTAVPAFDGQAAFGGVNARAIHVNTAWSDRADAAHDHALVILDHDLGHQTGWFGVSTPMEGGLDETTLVAVPGAEPDDERSRMTEERILELNAWVRDGVPDGDDLSPPESTADFDLSHRKIDQFYGFTIDAGVQMAVCDFNGDGNADIALSGPNGWRSIPVAFSNGDGTFTVTNEGVDDFPIWAAEAGANLRAIDVDRDGFCDLTLTGVAGWTTIPVAYSNGDGHFRDINPEVPEFAAFAATPGARIVAGDFDNDGYGDLAAAGVAGWPTIRMAFGRAASGFTPISTATAAFFSARPGFNARVAAARQVVAGDFNGDFRTDIAAIHTFPERRVFVAFSEGGGFFRATELESSAFMGWAGIEGVQVSAADMDGDGRDDLVAAGYAAWDSVIVGRSAGDGTFGFEKRMLGATFAGLAADRAQVLVGDFDGNDRADLALARPGRWFGTPVALSKAPALVYSERNDTHETASSMHLDGYSAPRRKIGTSLDHDYYRFTIRELRQVTIRAESNPRRGDLTFDLQDAWGRPVADADRLATPGVGLGATDTIALTLGAGTYYLHVHSFGWGHGGGYHLSADSTVITRHRAMAFGAADF